MSPPLAGGRGCRSLFVLLVLSLLPALWVTPVFAAIRVYQGSVTINDRLAADGTLVSVTVEGKTGTCASTLTVNGSYVLNVVDSGGSCPDAGSRPRITFFVNDVQVGSIIYAPGEGAQVVDLVVNQAGEALSGTVTIGGVPAPAGTAVAVHVQGSSAACVTATVGTDGRYELIVPPLTANTPNCPATGQTLTFRVGAAMAAQTVPFEPARSRSLDLTAAPPGHTVSGTAVVSGQPAASTPVQAFVGQTLCGETTTDMQGRFTLTVAPVSQQPGCGTNGAMIIFTIGGQRASQSLTFQSGGTTLGFNLSTSAVVCLFREQSPPDGSLIAETRPLLSITIACPTTPGAVTMMLDGTPVPPVVAGSGNIRTATYQPLSPLATGLHTVAVAVAAAGQVSWTFTIGQALPQGLWLDRPPASPGAMQSCPPPGQWRLLYWSGSSDVPISSAAQACPDAVLFWLNRQGRWFGFAKASPDASDLWYSLHGEAVLVRGR